jgi:hypothetical protein
MALARTDCFSDISESMGPFDLWCFAAATTSAVAPQRMDCRMGNDPSVVGESPAGVPCARPAQFFLVAGRGRLVEHLHCGLPKAMGPSYSAGSRALPRVAAHEIASLVLLLGCGLRRIAFGGTQGIGWHSGQEQSIVAKCLPSTANCSGSRARRFSYFTGRIPLMGPCLESLLFELSSTSTIWDGDLLVVSATCCGYPATRETAGQHLQWLQSRRLLGLAALPCLSCLYRQPCSALRS